MRFLNALHRLRTVTHAWLLAAAGVFSFTTIVSMLFFCYSPMELGSLFITTMVVMAVLAVIIWFIIFIGWILFGKPNVWIRLFLGIALVAALCFGAMYIPEPIVADLGEMLEPVFSSLKK